MKRREVMKGLGLLAGGAVCAPPAWPFLSNDDKRPEATPLAVPIRGLIRKNGELVQPIRINIPAASAGTSIITRVNGRELDRRTPSANTQNFDVYLPAVEAPTPVDVAVDVAGKSTSLKVTLEPVRKVQVFILPHSHHDLGYTDLQANVEEKQMLNITKGIDLARRTANNVEGARFVWNLEVLWGADLFLRRKSQADKDEFVTAVKKGWLGLNGMYANELTGLCRPEELLQLFRYSTELGSLCGVPVNSAMLSDVPGFTWGTVTAMAQAGIRYFSAAPNYFDRIGTFMVEWQDKPFWWISPSGKEKLLVWVPWTGYAMSHIMKLSAEWVGKYQARLDEVKFPYDLSCIRWSGHGDNAEPDPELPEFIHRWNTEYEWPRFTISTTSDAFSAFEKRHGRELPEFKGDLTPYWEDGAGSSALETRMSRTAADRLTQAETLAAMFAPAAYRASDFNEAWRNVLLYSEHTWGAWNSVSDSENPFVTKQWDFKRKFAVDAEKDSKSLLEDVLRLHATGKDASVIDVHNTSSWPRTEVVLLSKEMSSAGDHVKDEKGTSVASQRLSTGELALLAKNVPPFGSARFHLSSAPSHAPESGVSVTDGVLDNGIVRLKIDAASGNIVELFLRGSANNLVDTSRGEAVNKYLFLEGKDLSKIQSSGPAQISVVESGPLVASIRIQSPAPGCESGSAGLVRTVTLAAGADWIELANRVDKKQAPLNPHPGNGDQGGEFAQHQAKESLQFAFPFAVPSGQIRMDIPLANMRPDLDQLPGSCKNWLPVGRWIDVANAQSGVTWVTLDAPLVEIGDITATMLGSQTNPGIWRKHIEPTQRFYSWAMNNHWGTNYRAYQQGPVEFRYALRPHSGYDAAAATRLATSLSQPLIVSAAGSNALAHSLFHIDPADVLAIGCKPSADGKAWMVQLFGASGENQRAKLTLPRNPSPQISHSNLSEKALSPAGPEIDVAAWDLVTVRVERG